jgi:hypothetical protein
VKKSWSMSVLTYAEEGGYIEVVNFLRRNRREYRDADAREAF